MLLDAGKSVDCVHGGETPIMIAAQHDQMNAVIMLADWGADLSADDFNGCNLLHLIVR